MSECCFCFFSDKDSERITECSVSQWTYKKPLSLDIYPGETGRPSKIKLHFFSACKNVLSALPRIACSEHRDPNGKWVYQNPK